MQCQGYSLHKYKIYHSEFISYSVSIAIIITITRNVEFPEPLLIHHCVNHYSLIDAGLHYRRINNLAYKEGNRILEILLFWWWSLTHRNIRLEDNIKNLTQMRPIDNVFLIKGTIFLY